MMRWHAISVFLISLQLNRRVRLGARGDPPPKKRKSGQLTEETENPPSPPREADQRALGGQSSIRLRPPIQPLSHEAPLCSC